MTTLANQFNDPFEGVTTHEWTDFTVRCDKYAKVLEAARNCIRKLEFEIETLHEQLDGLEEGGLRTSDDAGYSYMGENPCIPPMALAGVVDRVLLRKRVEQDEQDDRLPPAA